MFAIISLLLCKYYIILCLIITNINENNSKLTNLFNKNKGNTMQTTTKLSLYEDKGVKIEQSTGLRFSINSTLQKLKKKKIASKELIDDLRFIIFDYLDTYEQNNTEFLYEKNYSNEFFIEFEGERNEYI